MVDAIYAMSDQSSEKAAFLTGKATSDCISNAIQSR